MAVVNNKEAFRKVRRRLTDHREIFAWIEVSKVPLRDQSGKIVGIPSTAGNTRELDLEKQLLQSQKMEAIGTLAGGIADFSNILTSIINSTELAIGDVDPESQTAKDLERVLKAARRGGRVVKQILTFSKPSQEGFRPTILPPSSPRWSALWRFPFPAISPCAPISHRISAAFLPIRRRSTRRS